ncbi:MAG TPA: helix-turn-helix domain-containing protein [Myxococcota bacterium]
MARVKLDPPRGVLSSPSTTTQAHVRYARFHPAAALAASIEHYWSVRWDLDRAMHRAETLGHPSVHAIFEDGKARIWGPATQRFERVLTGRDRVFGVKFRPGTFRGLTSSPVSQLADHQRAFTRVFRDGRAFADAILRTDSPEQCAALADEFFTPRVPPLSVALAATRDLVERLAKDATIKSVDDAATLAGTDVRTLQRRFRDRVGVSPKWIIQRYRLHEAAARIERDPRCDLAALAVDVGYFDQPHFSRAFKKLVGVTPHAFASARR